MKSLVACIMAGFLLLGVMGEVSGRSISASLNIQATVLPWLEHHILHDHSVFKITPAAIKKGYQDVHVGTVLSVTTNDTNGYIISVNSYGVEAVTSIVVTTDGGVSYVISLDGGVEIHEPYSGSTSEIKKLSYRFYLSPEAEAGFYPWPIIVTAYPL